MLSHMSGHPANIMQSIVTHPKTELPEIKPGLGLSLALWASGRLFLPHRDYLYILDFSQPVHLHSLLHLAGARLKTTP